MAVNIDTVYQTVLAIANKEQRGYITPLEFNLLASKAQRNIFEQYFYDINKFNKMPGNSTEFSDMLYMLEEKIAPFKVNDVLLTSNAKPFEDTFELDIADWTAGANGTSSHVAPAASNNYNGGLKVLQNANSAPHTVESDTNAALTAGKKYVVNWEIIDMDEPSSYYIIIDDAGSNAHSYQQNEPQVGALSFTFIADTTGNHNIRIINSDTSNAGKYITVGNISIEKVDDTTIGDGGANALYRLGEVTWQNYGASYAKQVPEVTASQIKKYNASPLARPTRSNPVYVRTSANSIELHPTPSPIVDQIKHSYVKTPTDPYWGYVVVPNSSGGNEYPLYNAASSNNFELHESEEDTLVNKILEYAGVIMKQPDVVQYANGKNNEEFQKENS
jgi:hypothetical protein